MECFVCLCLFTVVLIVSVIHRIVNRNIDHDMGAGCDVDAYLLDFDCYC